MRKVLIFREIVIYLMITKIKFCFTKVMSMRKSYEMDMVHGPLLKNILLYAFPLMLSGILQLLFNAADIIVVGRFAATCHPK